MPSLFQRAKNRLSIKRFSENYPWSIFRELEDSLNLIEDFDQIALNFLGKIKEIIPVTKQALFIYDLDLGKFRVSSFMGFSEPEIRNVSFSSAGPLAKWLKINKVYLSIRQQRDVLDYLNPEERAILTSLGVELCYPLISMNRLIGVLLLGPKKNRPDFSKNELAFISSLTPQAGIALENALLYKEQRERFRRMLRADKLATIGELAAGAAHEIRNPLTAIKSSLQYLESKSADDSSRKILGTALQETERIDEILSALLSFSRPSEIKKEKHDLLETLGESLDLISFQAKTQKVNLLKKFPSAPVWINGDKSQLKQLFLNLFLNALQAMKEGGQIKVEVSQLEGQRVLVAVTDSGEGIPEENLDKIFDPFFTTKKGGTGLGLSICYTIVKTHHGDIEIKSKASQGTTALVKLPQNL
jgi:two-component system, NtrC family, sensor kinase